MWMQSRKKEKKQCDKLMETFPVFAKFLLHFWVVISYSFLSRLPSLRWIQIFDFSSFDSRAEVIRPVSNHLTSVKQFGNNQLLSSLLPTTAAESRQRQTGGDGTDRRNLSQSRRISVTETVHAGERKQCFVVMPTEHFNWQWTLSSIIPRTSHRLTSVSTPLLSASATSYLYSVHK